jgi:RNA polymerase sigma-70 factor (ECF subfamily)
MSRSNQTIEQVFRDQHGRVLAALVAHLGDLDLAEDALQDACVLALKQWHDGLPDNPAAWLTTVAKRQAVDRVRRIRALERKTNLLGAEMAGESLASPGDDEMDELNPIEDERLKLMFMCCHPALALDAQVALTLRSLGGLSTDEVARAFLVPVPTMAQRLARAKQKIRAAGIPFRVPPTDLLPERLDALMATIYLIFNEGYAAHSGDAIVRQDLCTEAIRLGQVLVNLLPSESTLSAEPLGLLALMLLHDARRPARIAPSGDLILLEDQDRALWNRQQIARGEHLLDEALTWNSPGPYQIQAAISALHCAAPGFDETDWAQIAELYGALEKTGASPVVRVNRAVAVGMAWGWQKGLHLLLPLEDELAAYAPCFAAKADLLRRSSQREAATDAYERALVLSANEAERAYFRQRIAEIR